MSERLLIRLHPDGKTSWLTLNAQSRAASAANAGAPPAQVLARTQRVVAIVPSENVVLLDTPRMSAQSAQFAKAVPFALEDQLISPVEELYFALPDRLTGDRVAVAVVARKTLRGWIEQLASVGVRPDAIFAETQLLPLGENAGSVMIENDRAIWRSSKTQGGVSDLAGLPEWLAVIHAGQPELHAMDVYDFRERASAPALPERHVRYHPNKRDALSFLAAQLVTEPELNLLQGEFAPTHRRAPTQRLWRNAGLLAAAALILLFVYFVADYWKLSRQSAQLETAARQILHDSFPQMDTVAGDPRQLMQSALDGLRGGADATGLLHLLTQVAPALSSTTRTTLTSLEYHNATLELGLRAPDVPTLDLMRERLSTVPGLNVQVTAANTSANGVDGRLRIAGGKP
jgi:general secretion pathway protein L